MSVLTAFTFVGQAVACLRPMAAAAVVMATHGAIMGATVRTAGTKIS